MAGLSLWVASELPIIKMNNNIEYSTDSSRCCGIGRHGCIGTYGNPNSNASLAQIDMYKLLAPTANQRHSINVSLPKVLSIQSTHVKCTAASAIEQLNVNPFKWTIIIIVAMINQTINQWIVKSFTQSSAHFHLHCCLYASKAGYFWRGCWLSSYC